MDRHRNMRSLVAAGLALSLGVAAPAWSQGYDLSAVVITDQPAPGTSGDSLEVFRLHLGGQSINDAGDVVFKARLKSTQAEGIYLNRDGVITQVLVEGDPAPGGGSYALVDSAAIDDAGAIYVRATRTVGTPGIFKVVDGVHTVAVESGIPVPGTGGGTLTFTASEFTVSDSGVIATCTGISGGTVTRGIVRVADNVASPVALVGDPAPGTGGATYTQLFCRTRIGSTGDVVFEADTDSNGITDGIFLDEDGVQRALALDGDPAPGTGGGIYLSPIPGGIPFNMMSPVVNGSGVAAFYTGVTVDPPPPGVLLEGIFVDAGGTDSLVAIVDQVAPDTGGEMYGRVPPPSGINDAGEVFFAARYSTPLDDGIFFASDGVVRPVVLEDRPVPVPGGGTFGEFSTISANDRGDVVFYGLTSSSTTNGGIFKATRRLPAAPGLGPWGAVFAAALLLGAAGLGAWRQGAAVARPGSLYR
ncbi:MAG: choice-of-anchor tandem repeat NxxGxxAF-containing protein [Myxococcota bacterium]